MARSEYGAPNFAASQNALSTTAEKVFEERETRRYAVIKNTDASIVVGIGATDAVSTTTGMTLAAGESIRLDTTAAIWMESASGTPTVALLEVYD
jgi:hypothetical protein